jgi:anion-transporting  ArsA/GET3 family ATPase
MCVGETHRAPIRTSGRDSFPATGVNTLRTGVTALLDKRLIFVTGKGGVGKSTVAAALGMVAARAGRHTIVAEVAEQDRVARAFTDEDSHFHEVRLADDLYTISIDPRHALEEYLALQVRVKALADLLTSSRMFQYFAAATPGMSELVTIGKIWELAQPERKTRGGSRYDLVIVDAPATGHGVAIMRTPKTFSDITRVGPIASQGRAMNATITDTDHTGVIAVALPEEMPVNETLTLRDELRSSLGMSLDRVIVNGLYPARFDNADEASLRRALDTAGTESRRAALQAALSERLRAERQREQLTRLRSELDDAPSTLPFLFEPELGPQQFETLSRELEASL